MQSIVSYEQQNSKSSTRHMYYLPSGNPPSLNLVNFDQCTHQIRVRELKGHLDLFDRFKREHVAFCAGAAPQRRVRPG